MHGATLILSSIVFLLMIGAAIMAAIKKSDEYLSFGTWATIGLVVIIVINAITMNNLNAAFYGFTSLGAITLTTAALSSMYQYYSEWTNGKLFVITADILSFALLSLVIPNTIF